MNPIRLFHLKIDDEVLADEWMRRRAVDEIRKEVAPSVPVGGRAHFRFVRDVRDNYGVRLYACSEPMGPRRPVTA